MNEHHIQKGRQMILAECEKHCTCNICGVKVAHCGKAEHFKKFHPEYSFHRAKGRYFCDICGKSIQSYEYLVKFHNHSRQISESNIIGKSKEGKEMVLTPAEKRNVCDACGERLISGRRGRKEEHFKKFHPEYSFHRVEDVKSPHLRCDICGNTVSGFKSLVKFHNHNIIRESDLTCNICGVKVARDGKADHFKKFHPEYSFHHANQVYHCDICGKTVSGYEHLVKSHNHVQMPTNSEIQRDSWLLENYYKIATFYIDCLDKSKTMKEFKITAYILEKVLYLADLNESIPPSTLKEFLSSEEINAIKNATKEEIKNKKEIPQMENNANNETQGISRDQIIGAIEEIIIENRQLKIRIKESTSISQEVLAGMNSELARYKKLKEEDNGVISELNRQLELCRIAKERAELALRQKIAEGQKAMIVKISNQEEKQSIEERPY